MLNLKDNLSEGEPPKPLHAARTRRRLTASLYQLRPLPLGIAGTLLISLFALLYLNALGLATAANQRLQRLSAAQAQLQQDNQYLREQEGTLQSPGYIEKQARQMGMAPADPGTVHTIIIPGLNPEDNRRPAKTAGRAFL